MHFQKYPPHLKNNKNNYLFFKQKKKRKINSKRQNITISKIIMLQFASGESGSWNHILRPLDIYILLFLVFIEWRLSCIHTGNF